MCVGVVCVWVLCVSVVCVCACGCCVCVLCVYVSVVSVCMYCACVCVHVCVCVYVCACACVMSPWCCVFTFDDTGGDMLCVACTATHSIDFKNAHISEPLLLNHLLRETCWLVTVRVSTKWTDTCSSQKFSQLVKHGGLME